MSKTMYNQAEFKPLPYHVVLKSRVYEELLEPKLYLTPKQTYYSVRVTSLPSL